MITLFAKVAGQRSGALRCEDVGRPTGRFGLLNISDGRFEQAVEPLSERRLDCSVAFSKISSAERVLASVFGAHTGANWYRQFAARCIGQHTDSLSKHQESKKIEVHGPVHNVHCAIAL